MIRWLLEGLIQLINRAITPRSLVRGAEEQRKIDSQTHQLALYQSPICPYCIKVWYTIKRLNLDIETRDISRHPHWRSELKTQGGKLQVPCLKIAGEDGRHQWLYESADIVDYLSQRFSSRPGKSIYR